MKKSVVFIVLLLTVFSVGAFTVSPPTAPFSSLALSSGGGGGSSLSFTVQPPVAPFSTTPMATGGSGSGGTGSGSGSGSTATQAQSGGGGSGGGGGGGGSSSGLIRIALSSSPAVKSIPLGRSIQFSNGPTRYPLLLLLRKIDVVNQNSNWVLRGKFYDLNKESHQLFSLNTDATPEVLIEIISFDRGAVIIKASIPGTAPVPRPATPAPAPRPVPSVQPAPRPAPVLLPEPVVEPVYEEVNQKLVILEPEPVSNWPVKQIAIGAGVLVILLAIIYGIRRWKSVPHTIEQYAEEGLRTGHDEDEIRKRLASAGWSKKEIDEAISTAEKKR